MTADPKIDEFIAKSPKWRDEFKTLRKILLESPLTEELKWGQPCYTLDGKNVAMLGGFKDFCIISFIKGVLLNDPDGLLVQQGEHTQSARVLKFTDAGQICALEKKIKEFIKAAADLEKAGTEVEYKKTAEFEKPEELENKLQSDSAFKAAFEKLTPGRQRAYILFFAGAKQSATRAARIEKCAPQILAGKGLND